MSFPIDKTFLNKDIFLLKRETEARVHTQDDEDHSACLIGLLGG